MIRLQIKNQRLLGDALYAVVSVIAFIWISLGWLVMMPWTSSDSLLHPAKPLLPWQLGLAVWLGPSVIGGLGYLCVRIFHIEFISPRRLMREILEGSHS